MGQPPAPLKGRPRLLLVGDLGARPEGLERSLIHAGFEVAEAPVGALGGTPPAVVLLTALGEVDAAGSLDILRRRLTAFAPVVVTLLDGTPDGTVRLLEAGAADVLASPVHLPELLARTIVRVQAGQEAAAALAVSEQTFRLFEVFQELAAEPRAADLLPVMAHRLGDVLGLSHCAYVVAGPGLEQGRIAVAGGAPLAGQPTVPLWQYPEVAEAVRSASTVFVPDVMLDPLFLRTRVRWQQSGTAPSVTAAVAIPVSQLGRVTGGVVLRSGPSERLGPGQVRLAERLVRATARLLDSRAVPEADLAALA